MKRRISKNARVMSTGPKKPTVAPNAHFIISCDQGRYAYIQDVEGRRNVHAATRSQRFWNVVASNIDAGFGARLEAEFAELAQRFPGTPWADNHTRLVEMLTAADAESSAA